MEHHLPLIGRSPLFANIDAADLTPMLQCLGARKRTFPKGSYLFRVGDRTTAMGIMLEGSVRLEKEDYWGNRSILASFGPGQSFAEVYACEPDLAFDINVVAAEDATVLFLDIGRVTTMCPSSCAFHARLIRNLLGIVAKRTHALTRKSSTPRSARRAPSCCRTSPTRRKPRTPAASSSRSTARSWPTTCRWTAVPCAPSCRG